MRCSCVATNCSHQHRCNRCHVWQSPSAFGNKAAARKKCCMKCSEKVKVNNAGTNPKWNAINNAKTSVTKLANKIAYEQKTIGDKIDIGDEARAAAGQQCILTIKERLEVYKLLYPEGFMLAVYGTSTGSCTVEHEGRMQFSGRGYGVPPIVDANDKEISMTMTGPYGPGGEEVYDCGPSKVLSSVVEKAAQVSTSGRSATRPAP